VTGQWFSAGPLVSSTKITDRHDITEILLKVALRCNTTKHGYQSKRMYGKVVHKHKMDSYIVG